MKRKIPSKFEIKKIISYSLLGCASLIFYPSQQPLMAKENYRSIQETLKGEIVSTNDNTPIQGVSIKIKGTNTATSSNNQGKFEITTKIGDVLIISSVGYKPIEITVSKISPITINLEKLNSQIDDVVVVGYGTQKRKQISGSISSVKGTDIQTIPSSSFENAILGMVSGVQVQEPSGEPGAGPSIRVRGLGSISAGNEPLYVIDGYPYSKNVSSGVLGDVSTRTVAFAPPSSNPLASINTADIESIDILKDAAASAIYGSRASNGVIIVTTKRGKRNQAGQIHFDAFAGVQNVARRVQMMNAEEYAKYSIEAKNNAYVQDFPGASANDDNTTRYRRSNLAQYFLPDDFINPTGTNTDWQKEIFHTTPIQSYNLSFIGGSEKTNYFVAGGYFNQEGIIRKSGFERFNVRVNIDHSIRNNLKIGLLLNPSYTVSQKAPAGAPYFAVPPGIVYSALVTSPTVSPYLPDGRINQTDNQSHLYTSDGRGTGMTEASNPLAIIAGINDELKQYRTTAITYAEYEFIKDLKYKIYLGTDFNNFNRSFYRSKEFLFRQNTVGEPYAQSNASFNFNYKIENTINYDKTFNENHNINILLGYTAQKDQLEYNSVRAQNFPDDLVQTVSGGQVNGGTSVREAWSLASLISRANYSYKNKYLFSASFRSDRASRFGENKKTGTFPAFSVGYKIKEESFLKNATWLNDLKLRGSWGLTGNFLIPNYASIGLLDPNNYVFGDVIQNGLAPSTVNNKDLTWEKTEQINVGLDLDILKNRISTTIDWYTKKTSNLLLYVQEPGSTGFTTALKNIGQVQNRGFEIQLSSRNLVAEFKWNTDLNFSKNKNKVLKLGPNGDPILTTGAAGIRHITKIGEAIGSYYGYVVDGIYQTNEEVKNSLPDAIAPAARAGDFRFKDINGDGKINADDRTVIGNYQPDFIWGITNKFQYKGFDLSFLIQGSEGGEVLNLTRRHLGNGEGATNSYKAWNDRWVSTEQPGTGKIPRADRLTDNHGQNNRPSNFQVEDCSYIRLRNVTIAYTFSEKILKNKIKSARIYLSGNNLHTWTKYLGYNPEVNNQSQYTQVQGEDYGAYPLIRTYTLGVNIGF